MAHYDNKEKINQHFIAITAENEKAHALGIQTVLPIWDWVGGRFSLCSAVGLILMIAIGENNFKKMQCGAHEMDEHFRYTDVEKNMPIMLALLSMLNVNVRDIHTHSLMVYNNRLKYFPDYLQ